MASTHKSLRSGTANKRPTTSIAEGQIALNTNATSPGLYFKDSTGASIIKIGPVHVGTTAPNVAPAGSAGNSTGETWLDTSLTPNGWKVWTGAAWVNATPVGSATVQGLLELATDAETQAGSDTARAVTPAGLQSKVSDSTSTTSSTTIASSTAVKSAYDLANAALPKSGGTVTGNLEIGIAGSLSFEGATADAFETTIAVVDPTADRTITFPDTTGTIVTTGDTGSVTSTMILDGTILNADVNASAAIAGTKISPDFGSQNAVTTGTSTAASFIPTSSTAPTNGVYLPAANSVAISTGGSGRLFVDASGRVIVGAATAAIGTSFEIVGNTNGQAIGVRGRSSDNVGIISFHPNASATEYARIQSNGDSSLAFGTGSSGSERLRITSAGLVGIGTSVPASKLSLELTGISTGKTDGSNWGANGALQIGNSDGGTANSEVLIVGSQTGAAGAVGQIASAIGFGRGASGWGTYLNFYTHSNSTANIDELIERVRIDSSGNVGIGTTSPGEILAINGASNAEARLKIQNQTTTIGYLGSHLGIVGSGNANDLSLSTGGATNLTFGINTVEKVRIDSSGRVGIGNSSPGAKLDISGSGNLVRLGDGTNTFDVRFQGPNNWSTQLDTSTDKFNIQRNSISFVTVDSAGRLGIGTASPASLLCVGGNTPTTGKLSVVGDTNGVSLAVGDNTSSSLYVKHQSAGCATFGTDGGGSIGFATDGFNERARIDSSGRLLVGTSSAYAAVSGVTPSFQLQGTGENAYASIARWATNTANGGLIFNKSRGASVGTRGVVAANDGLGEITFAGDDGTNFIPGARIEGLVDGTPGANDMPGRLVFSTTADGAASPTERMRIASNGTLTYTINSAVRMLIDSSNNGSTHFSCTAVTGTDNAPNAEGGIIHQSNGNTKVRGTSVNNTLFQWYYFNNTTSNVGNITVGASSTSYNTSSDYRLKENIVPLTGAIDRLNNLQIHRFNFKVNPDHTVDGFLAHEAQAVVPECVTGTKDEVDTDGNPVYQGIDQSKLVPLLTAALQEAIAKIETLEARLTAAGIA